MIEVETETKESRIYRMRWWTLFAVSLSVLIVVLDSTVMNVALPTIQAKLNATSTELEWMVNAYTLVLGALMLTSGLLGDRLGRAKLLQAGVALFGLSSLAAIFAGTATILIICRIFMGLGAALIMPNSLAIVTNIFPAEERGRAIGVWVGISSVGVALGPVIGGSLVQNFNWNSIFIINIPVVFVALVAGWFLIPNSRDDNPRKLDIPGNILAIGALAILLFGLINGGSWGWTNTGVLGSLCGSVILIALFILWERRVAQPMLEIGFFRNSRFSASIGAVCIMGLALNGVMYILTYYMQFVKGYTPLETGVRFIPLASGLFLGAGTVDRVVKRLDTKRVVLAGFIAAAIVLSFMSRFSIESPFWQLGIGLFFLGFFLGYIVAPAMDALMGALPEAQAGIGSGMANASRMVAGAVGVAALGSALSSIYSAHFDKAAATIPGLPIDLAKKASDSVGRAIGIAHSGKLPADTANALTQAAKHSFMDGWQTATVISAVIFVAGALTVLKFMPGRTKYTTLVEDPHLD